MAYLIKEPISSSSRGLRRQPRELNACLTQLGRGRAELDRRQCSLDYGVAGLLLRAKRASRLTFSSPPCLQAGDDLCSHLPAHFIFFSENSCQSARGSCHMQRPAWQTGGSWPALERTEAHKRTESGRARGGASFSRSSPHPPRQ